MDHEAIKQIDEEIGNLKREKKDAEGPLAEIRKVANTLRQKAEETKDKIVSRFILGGLTGH